MPTSNVPTPQLGPNGYTVPDQSAVLTGVFADMNAAFGGNLDPGPATPQGQLAASFAAIIGDADDQLVALFNGVDPAYASGRMQDAIARIYFLTRNPAQPTTVTCTCTGLAGVVIPAGSLAVASDGNLYSCTSGGTIPVGGSISLAFACTATGPIACPANSLTTIYRAIPGWDTINNPSDGVLGANVESRADFEHRRALSVAQNSLGSLPSILGAVLSVPNVVDAYVTENTTASPVTVGGQTLVANSVYVCASGGTDAAVAQAIWTRKAPGCAYTGSTTVTVTDTNSGYSIPYPTYTVKFQRPTSLPICFAVTMTNNTGIPSNALAQVQAAIQSGFSGADGGQRARIGSTIYGSRYYADVAALGSWAQIVSITIGSTNALAAVVTASVAGTVMTVTAVSSGTLAVGQFVFGANIAAGTYIVSLGSGSGGTGTYNVNVSQTAASATVNAVAASLNSIAVNINQVPTLNVGDITLTLV